MENTQVNLPAIHNQGTFKVKPEKFDEFKHLVIKSLELIKAKISQNGPVSWDASFDKENNIFYINGVFQDMEAVKFHQGNIADIVKEAGPMLAEPPVSIITEVFSFLDVRAV